MRYSVRDLMLLPLLGFAACPLVVTASLIGLMVLPQFTANNSEICNWFLDHGFSVDFVTGHLTFFASEIPTILVLFLLALHLFAMQTRICDQAAVITLASLPFVNAIHVDAMSDAFNVDYLGWRYLATQSLTALTLAGIIVAYVLARLKIPNPIPTRTRVVISGLLLALIFVPSAVVWKNAT